MMTTDRTIRDRALSSLQIYLKSVQTLTPLDCLKLWKALYYCMWMSDKPRTQQQLARDLASLVDLPRTPTMTLAFLEAFWRTMAREWTSIDALRMDKFLYLVRCYVRKGFEWLASQGWGEKLRVEDQEGDGESQEKSSKKTTKRSGQTLLQRFVRMLESTPLNVRDAKIPNGLRFHVVDLFVDELDNADTKKNAPLETLLQPMRNLEKNSPSKALRKRVTEALGDERLQDWTAERAG